jgi:hypothetical protein
MPSVTSQIGELEGGEAFVVLALVLVLVVDVVVVVVVLVVVVVVAVLVDVLNVVVLVDGVVSEGQSFHPSSLTDVSEYHVMSSLGVTPSGPSVPSYSTPSTVSLS